VTGMLSSKVFGAIRAASGNDVRLPAIISNNGELELADIFLSHASTDARLADAFVQLVEGGIGVLSGQIFCTSLEEHDISPSAFSNSDFVKAHVAPSSHMRRNRQVARARGGNSRNSRRHWRKFPASRTSRRWRKFGESFPPPTSSSTHW
jgi:hypothetical protein